MGTYRKGQYEPAPLTVWRRFHDNTPLEIKGSILPAVADVYGFSRVITLHKGDGWRQGAQDCFRWLRGRRPRSGEVYLMGPLRVDGGWEIRWAFAPHRAGLASQFRQAFGTTSTS